MLYDLTYILKYFKAWISLCRFELDMLLGSIHFIRSILFLLNECDCQSLHLHIRTPIFMIHDIYYTPWLFTNIELLLDDVLC